MNFLDTLLKVELKTVSSNPTFTILTSVIFSIILMILLWNQNINTFLCIFIGALIFWERYLILKIKNTDRNL
ncbi:Uncharacterised protein [Acinetobacter baumannii]|nr:hypothetical protein AYR69_05190 [Acinetobacter baumannii]ENW66517.1 hypothetical protein F912_04114 [Acinetobacter baumannii ANC 4097]AOX83386.1 hypothetical protein KAB04_03988 [Acinetobacter baumannii]AOX98881.1 hypothetical protein KAB08_03947 [Acinetobacter baumannii]ARG29740.1 hypothetical protein B7L41_00270 [Acinetobacter baumannii]